MFLSCCCTELSEYWLLRYFVIQAWWSAFYDGRDKPKHHTVPVKCLTLLMVYAVINKVIQPGRNKLWMILTIPTNIFHIIVCFQSTRYRDFITSVCNYRICHNKGPGANKSYTSPVKFAFRERVVVNKFSSNVDKTFLGIVARQLYTPSMLLSVTKNLYYTQKR